MLKTGAQDQSRFSVWRIVLLAGIMLLVFPLVSAASNRSLSVFEHIEYSNIAIHIGFENEVSAHRLNYPLYISISGQNWKSYNEQFRQLGELTDLWDLAQRGDILLDDARNVPLTATQSTFFQRQVRIVRADWNVVGENCGYRSNGTPNSGCAFNKRLPKCTIIVPHQHLYAGGNINDFHQLLGHEMWHCMVGSFH